MSIRKSPLLLIFWLGLIHCRGDYPAAAQSQIHSADIPVWSLEWSEIAALWDPAGGENYEPLPDGMVTLSLIERETGQLLVGSVEIGNEEEKKLILNMILDDRIRTSLTGKDIILFSSTPDHLELRLIITAAAEYLFPEQHSVPNASRLPDDAIFSIFGSLTLSDSVHTWLFPRPLDEPITFHRLSASGSEQVQGFQAFVDFTVENRFLDPDSLILYIDVDADGEVERTIVAHPLTAEKLTEVEAEARAKVEDHNRGRWLEVIQDTDRHWEWLNPFPAGNDLRAVCADMNGDLFAVDDDGLILIRQAGIWRVDDSLSGEAL
ncbi:MAG: hypothetical protein ABIF77_15160, partial [bacterium]